MSVAAQPAPFHISPLPDLEAPAVDPTTLTVVRTDPRQGTLSLVHEDRPRPVLRRVFDDEDDFGPRHTPTDELPDAQPFSARMAVTLLQIASGARPPTQVMRHCSPAVYDSIVRRHGVAVRRRVGSLRPIRVRRVLVCHPCDGIVEATAVLDDGHRPRALALRLEGTDGRWVVTALQIG